VKVHRRVRLLRAVALTAALAAAVGGGLAQDVDERVVLLPVQDRVGDTGAIARLEAVARRLLEHRYELVPPEQVREAMRRLRLRDPRRVPPATLREFADELAADAFISVSLLDAARDPVPRAVLSGQSIDPASLELRWAGFEAASAVDDVDWFGAGGANSLESLLDRLALRLVDDLTTGRAGRTDEPEGTAVGFLRRPLSAGDLGRVAVIPFDGITDTRAGQAAEIATDLALAVLHRRGLRIAAPSAVEEVLLQRSHLLYGGLDELTRAALRAGGRAETLFTGAVEEYESAVRGLTVEPTVAIAARVVDARSGQILWIGGIERSGWDDAGAFGLGREYSAGVLAEQIMQNLVTSFSGPVKHRARRTAP
jgi:hypothetical protein